LTDEQVGQTCVEMLTSFLGRVRTVPKLRKVTRWWRCSVCCVSAVTRVGKNHDF